MSTYEISKSSLLSLKAEILRKQEELSKTKAENEVKKRSLKNNPILLKNKGVEERNNADQTEEDENLLEKSKSVLEAKTKLYEKLSQSKNAEELSKSQYLVRFNDKVITNKGKQESDIDKDINQSNYSDTDDNIEDSGQKWVDYIDCFGRSRRCMQKDLEYFKLRDKGLNETVERENQEPDIDKNEADIVMDGKEMLHNDARRELLREQWEKEEITLLNKNNIHYQDLLFGEARSHGVGYYSFSKDEEERTKQQEALKKLREETKMEQKKAKDLRNVREKMLACRLKAARNRKRARIGLPPEEDELEVIPIVSPPDDKNNQEIELKKQQKEELLEIARKNHVRPWDIGKEGIKEQVMSQNEWVEKERDKRPEEFAPPMSYRVNFIADKSINVEPEEDSKTLRFSTKKGGTFNKNKLEYQEIAQPSIMSSTSIEDIEDNEKKNRSKGTEIPPPPIYDYYGPSSSKIKKKDSIINLEDSIEAGLKFIRKQIEQKKKSSHEEDMFLF